MAQKLGVSQKQYSLYESDDANLEWKTIERIAVAFGIDPVNLIGFDEREIFSNITQSGNVVSSTLNNKNKEVIDELIKQLKEKDEQIKLLISKIS